MSPIHARSWAGAFAFSLLTASVIFAQTPPPAGTQQEPPPGRGARNTQGRVGRQGMPPVTPNMNQQQLNAYLDTYQLWQAERELQLNDEQLPAFVRRLRRLQDVKRRHQVERRKIIGELSGLLQGSAEAPARDENILGRLRALDDVSQRAAGEVRKAYEELDASLTPWQRGRFRLLEEQMERRKVELLGKIGAGG